MSYRFACQQRVLKTFPGPRYHRSHDRIVQLWDSLVSLFYGEKHSNIFRKIFQLTLSCYILCFHQKFYYVPYEEEK